MLTIDVKRRRFGREVPGWTIWNHDRWYEWSDKYERHDRIKLQIHQLILRTRLGNIDENGACRRRSSTIFAPVSQRGVLFHQIYISDKIGLRRNNSTRTKATGFKGVSVRIIQFEF